jgi:hypothetical protein
VITSTLDATTMFSYPYSIHNITSVSISSGNEAVIGFPFLFHGGHASWKWHHHTNQRLWFAAVCVQYVSRSVEKFLNVSVFVRYGGNANFTVLK